MYDAAACSAVGQKILALADLACELLDAHSKAMH
jgi:hypothetical protein